MPALQSSIGYTLVLLRISHSESSSQNLLIASNFAVQTSTFAKAFKAFKSWKFQLEIFREVLDCEWKISYQYQSVLATRNPSPRSQLFKLGYNSDEINLPGTVICHKNLKKPQKFSKQPHDPAKFPSNLDEPNWEYPNRKYSFANHVLVWLIIFVNLMHCIIDIILHYSTLCSFISLAVDCNTQSQAMPSQSYTSK